MNPWILLGLGLAGIALALWIPRYRLNRALAKPFPAEWTRFLEQNIKAYGYLPPELQARLRHKIKRFLHRKHFTGCGGLELTDEIRVTIAGEACMLLLNHGGRVYPGLRYILVYPGAFLVDHDDYGDDGVVARGAQALHGESWDNGRVILAWDQVLHGSRDSSDGENVVLHEFAHQLDGESGATDGAPLLAGQHSYRTWASAFTAEFVELQKDARRGRQSLIDHYGATNPAEFFAVATETFFEQPWEMSEEHEELFRHLRRFYRVDPRKWHQSKNDR